MTSENIKHPKQLKYNRIKRNSAVIRVHEDPMRVRLSYAQGDNLKNRHPWGQGGGDLFFE